MELQKYAPIQVDESIDSTYAIINLICVVCTCSSSCCIKQYFLPLMHSITYMYVPFLFFCFFFLCFFPFSSSSFWPETSAFAIEIYLQLGLLWYLFRMHFKLSCLFEEVEKTAARTQWTGPNKSNTQHISLILTYIYMRMMVMAKIYTTRIMRKYIFIYI